MKRSSKRLALSVATVSFVALGLAAFATDFFFGQPMHDEASLMAQEAKGWYAECKTRNNPELCQRGDKVSEEQRVAAAEQEFYETRAKYLGALSLLALAAAIALFRPALSSP